MENDERARVARALREIETPTWPTLTEAVMGHVATRDKVVGRLADLIEPPRQCPYYHSDRHYCSAYDEDVREIDRDALLALSEEMDAYPGCDDARCGREMPPLTIHGFARRIREALGVEE